MGIAFCIVLYLQFRTTKYIPGIYWLTVVLISVFGTLVTDNLTDARGVPLEVSTVVFSVLLGLTFLFWYLSEKTLSVHSIYTRKREAFYLLTILFTFALGTAVGDLYSDNSVLVILTQEYSNNFTSAKNSVDDLEHQWDTSEPKLRKIDGTTWTKIDGTIDVVLAAVRSANPDASKSKFHF